MAMAKDLQIGISTPWDLAALRPPQQSQRLASIADAGIDFLFTADHVSFHDGSGIDGVVRLAALGAMEPRLGLYLGVFLLALRHPVVAARQIATLAELTPGRVTIGIGVGGEDRHEFEICSVDPSTRGRRTDRALEQVRALLAGDTVDGDGEFFQFEQAKIVPVPEPAIPFVVGGRSDAALHRAGRLGDGWLAAWCSARRFSQGVELVQEVGSERDVAWRHGLQLWIGVGRNPEEGRAHVAKGMADFYKLDFRAFEKYTPVGTAGQIAEFLKPYVDAGATNLNLTPCGANRETEIEAVARVKELLA